MKSVIVILILSFLGVLAANGQPNCVSPAPGDSCHQSPFLCGNYIDNYCAGIFGFNGDSLAGQWYPNAGFIRFSPCSDSVALSVLVNNCAGGATGLSFALFEGTCPSQSPLFSYDLLQDIPDTLTFVNLQPDSIYSLLISGTGGDGCAFNMQVVEGIGTAGADTVTCNCSPGSIDGPMVLCPGDIGTYTVVLPICSLVGGGPIGGNGYSCSPPNICPAQDSLVWQWHIPASTYFIGDSTGLSIQIGVDSTISNLDTLIMDSIWISWALVPTGMSDPLLICDCLGSACSGTIQAKQVVIKHDIEAKSCTLTCINPQCIINGIIYSAPGIFIDKVDNCLTEIITITENFQAPFPPIILPITICQGASAVLIIQNFNPSLLYLWSTGANGPSIVVAPTMTTSYFVTVIDPSNGCTVMGVVAVTVLPQINNNLGIVGTISCAQPCVVYQGSSYCNPGVYTKMSGPCSVDTFEIAENIDTPIVSPPILDCLPSNSEFVVTFSITGQPPFKVNGFPLTGSNYLSGPILNNTLYSFIIEQNNGCQVLITGTFDCAGACVTDAGEIGQNLLEGCSGQSTVTALSVANPVSGPGAVIEYWLTDASGAIVQQNSSGAFAFDPNSMATGETYFIQRIVGIPDANGHPDLLDPCTDTTGKQPVIFHPLPAALSTGYSPVCFGESTGQIAVQLIDGEDPLEYALNNGNFSTEMQFDSLPPGEYTVHIQDGNGCRSDTTLTLLAADSLGLSIGPNLEVILGDEVTLTANALTAPVLVNWWSNIGLSQMGGLQWTLEPQESMQITCAIIDANGCTDTTAISITVETTYKFYMPNAFSPNGDQANDVFKPVYRGNIFKEYYLAVYSRWGERVFETRTPGDGWDGRHRGKLLNSDVYVYVFEYEYENGEKSALRKEVTLLR
jgi:gliding motility-associated-like protein